MIYYVYLRTAYIPYQKVKQSFNSIEKVNDFLDNVEDFTDYLVIGYDDNKEPYTDMGKIDKPPIKKLIRKNGDK